MTRVARHRVFYIARAREVGQSWWSTVFTLVLSFLDSLLLVFRELPELVLCDGPGTCLPVCCAAFVLRFCGLKNTKIVFVESFARVKTLSLTGKCLLFVVDRFVVQWKELLDVGFLGRPLGDGWGAEHIGYLLWSILPRARSYSRWGFSCLFFWTFFLGSIGSLIRRYFGSTLSAPQSDFLSIWYVLFVKKAKLKRSIAAVALWYLP